MRPDRKPDGGADAAHPTYSATARRFHWWMVLLIALQMPLGLFMVSYGARTNFAAPTGQLYDLHKLMGMLILALAVARLAYRLLHGAPPDEPTLEPWQRVVSHITHWMIYALIVLVPLTGWLAASAYGPFAPFGMPLPRLLGESQDFATRLFGMHEVLSKLLILLAIMHVGAALFHYVVRKDGVLNRMWPGLPRRDGR